MRRVSTRVLPYFCSLSIALAVGCDSKKPIDTEPAASAAPTHALPPPPTPEKEVAPVEKEEEPAKKEPKICKPGTIAAFDSVALENQVRLKIAKPKGDVTMADLGKVRSLNLSQTKVDELDPCIYPHFTNLKDLFLGQGKLDDLGPIAGLKNIEPLRASLNRVTDLKPLEKLVKMDRLDLGHT